MFQGFPEETIRFFLDLRFHNEVTWFHAHREEYEEYIRKPFREFIEAVAPAALQVSEDMETRPNRCLARINRDIRFTRDKSPYRDHLWLLFRRAGEERDKSVMYWFELGPDAMNWGLGFWGPNRPAMDAFREMMLTKPSKVRKAFREAGIPDERFLLSGSRFARMKLPEGLPEDLASLYPLKEFYVERAGVSLSEAYSPALAETVSRDYLRLRPLYLLMREAADRGMAAPDN